MALWTHWLWFTLFGLMWVLIAGNNLICWIAARKSGGGTSLTLFLGGFFGAAAAIACPIEGAWMWFWLPALVDPGSIPAAMHILLTRNKDKPE